MPRPAADYTPYRAFITSAVLEEGQTASHVVKRLKDEHQVDIALRSLQRLLAKWSISTRPRCKVTEELRTRVSSMVYQDRLSDEEMVQVLVLEGFEISINGLQRLRKRYGLSKRTQPEQSEEVDERIREVLREEHSRNATVIEDLGRNDLYLYITEKYHIVGRDRIYRIARTMAPDGLQRRQKKTRSHQVLEAVTPDHAGSIDSHFETLSSQDLSSQAMIPFLPLLYHQQMSAKPNEGGAWRGQYVDSEGNFHQTPWLYAQQP
ncbi:hypothetical protein BDV97DRAFT_394374 [Delphinella strobiligena]|nr:hypothetical protein BDV97DRAFT_394374 [Delphinella strobiligena]